LGCIAVFLPLFVFEIRHGFHQLQAVAYTLDQSVFHNSAVVGQVGLSKDAIIGGFLGRVAPLLQTPIFLGLLLEGIVLGYIICLKRYNLYHVVFTPLEKRLIAFLCFVSGSILFVYLSTKNPVWDYHFIGVEIILLFVLGIMMQKSLFLKKAMMYLLFFAVMLTGLGFLKSWYSTPEKQHGSYASILWVGKLLYSDAYGKPFTYYVATPAIYTFEYDYVLKMLDTQRLVLPHEEKDKAYYIYVLIPKEQIGDTSGFLENKTPSKVYKTTSEWNSLDETHIYRREKINK
jgi:hypothetical protein